MNVVNDLTPEQIAYWSDLKYARPIVMKAPPGEPDVTACAAVDTVNGEGHRIIRVAWKVDEIELVQLAEGGTIWLSTWGGLPPHQLEVQP